MPHRPNCGGPGDKGALLGAPNVAFRQPFYVGKADIEWLSETDIVIRAAELPSLRDYAVFPMHRLAP